MAMPGAVPVIVPVPVPVSVRIPIFQCSRRWLLLSQVPECTALLLVMEVGGTNQRGNVFRQFRQKTEVRAQEQEQEQGASNMRFVPWLRVRLPGETFNNTKCLFSFPSNILRETHVSSLVATAASRPVLVQVSVSVSGSAVYVPVPVPVYVNVDCVSE